MFDQSRFRDLNEYNEYLTRKLKHYNEWLMNPKRSLIAGAYPGFPEDVSYREIIQGMREDFQERRVVAEKQQEDKKLDKEKKPRAKKIEGPSRLVQAQEIYKRLNGDRASVVQAIQDELGMPASSAMTYFYNSKKVLGI